jgi:murein L,D-transpeptidase YcbB/YkuD
MELGEDENNEKVLNHIKLYDCKNIDDLKLFFEQNKEKQIFQIFLNLDKERQKEILNQINFINQQGLIDSYYTIDESLNNKFIEYKKKYANLNIESQVDEVGYVNNILTTAETARAFGGYERNAINTSISVTKDISETKEEEEVKKKNLFGAMLDKFKH